MDLIRNFPDPITEADLVRLLVPVALLDGKLDREGCSAPTVQEALRYRGLRWTPAKLMLGVDRDIVLARSRGWSARRIAFREPEP